MRKCSKSSSKRKVTDGTKEWADFNVNCIKGCYNDCRYCYAKMMAKRFRGSTGDTWKNMEIRDDVVNKSFKKWPGRVMFPSTHDIFGFPPYKEACFTVLRKLLQSGNEVLVTTKPRFNMIREIDHKFTYYIKQVQFRFTITSNNDRLLKFWEPNAPRFKERLGSLKYAFRRGYKTSVSVEPFLDYDPTELIKTVEPFTTESIWLGRMNYIPRNNLTHEDMPYYDEIRKNYETSHLWHLYDKVKAYSLVRIKDSVRIQLGLK